MPEISRFYGIIIRMYAGDHPPPHFHAEYGSDGAQFDIQTGSILEGTLPGRALRLVQDWAELHRQELMDNFNGLQSDTPRYRKIQPLE
ncbi:MAG: hypothetical protein C5B50_30130 [Verrucomicrobia bacterium]|nr:MAG: hypothetical protein C5B50_30130 [Verrucomicrobiota bacterium]